MSGDQAGRRASAENKRHSSFVDVPDPTTKGKHKKLFRYDPLRELIEIKAESDVVVVDLTKYKLAAEETDAGQRLAKPE